MPHIVYPEGKLSHAHKYLIERAQEGVQMTPVESLSARIFEKNTRKDCWRCLM